MNHKLLATSLLSVLLAGASLRADTLYWSGDGTTLGGPGTWDATNPRWGTSTTGPFTTVWNNASTVYTNATLSAGAGATPGGVITLANDVAMVGTLTWQNTPGSYPSYSISGASTVTFSPGSFISCNNSMGGSVACGLFNCRYAGTITKVGAAQIEFNNSNGNVTKFILNQGTASFASFNRFGSGADVPDFITFNGGSMRPNTTTAWTMGRSITVNSGNGTISSSSTGITITQNKPITWNNGNLTVNVSPLILSSTTSSGSGTLTLNTATTCNAANVIPSNIVVTAAGTLTLNNNSQSISSLSGAGTVSLGSGTLTLNNGRHTFSGAISGTGGLVKNGASIETLGGANSYTGNTTVNAGTLAIGVSGSIASSPIVTLASGALLDVSALGGGFALDGAQMLQGSGTVTGSLATAYGTRINPGSFGVPATLTFTNDLSLAPGTTNYFDLALSTTIGSGTNDLINIGGALNPSGATIAVRALGPLDTSTPYRVFNYAGAKGGSFDPSATALDSRYTFSVDETIPQQINVTVSGSPASLVWSAGATNTWDVNTSADWNADTESFFQADNVTFDDSSSSNTVALVGTLYPSSITVNASSNYVFQGSGKIGGPTGLTKSGTGVLTLSTANTFTGLIVVSNGILQAANASALGSAAAGTEIRSGATLDINGMSLYSPGDYITIAGNGMSNTGAVINSGAQQFNAIRAIGLAADASVAAWTNRWDVRGPGGSGSFSGLLDLNGYTFTKLGTGKVVVVDCVVTNAGSFQIAGGILDLVRSKIDGPGYINVSSNILQFENNTTGYVAKAISVNGGTIWSLGAMTGIGSLITNLGPATFQTDSALTLSNVVSGAGSLAKVGASSLTLQAVNTYVGNTVISNGTLALSGAGSIGASPNIVVSAGAVLDVTGRSDNSLTLGASQTLGGYGTVNGNVVANPKSSVSPGGSIGTLTVTSNLTLAGFTVMEIDSAGATNDLITGMASVTYGGTLVVSNINATPFAAGSFKLFNATNYTGLFSAISPTRPGADLLWNTNSLTVDGTLKIVPAVVARPRITTFTLSGTNLIFAGTNGTASGNFYLLGSTNVALPLTNWARLATNEFDAGGNFNLTNAIDPNARRQFYLLLVP